MAHGGHGHGDEIDFEAEFARELDPPYCQGNWRQVVGGLGVTAAVVLGIAGKEYFQRGGASPSVRQVAMMQMQPAVPMSMAAAPGNPVRPVMAVGNPTNAMGPAPVPSSDVRLVARNDRTSFNAVAWNTRPSVVGIRALVDGGGTAAAATVFQRVGSGVVVDGTGHVVTCRHVIEGAKQITVSRFRHPSERLVAQVVAYENDLALLRVSGAKTFSPAVIGDSSRVMVGDWILALGHPFGLGLTVTAGIVGRRNTSLAVPGGRRYDELLQTDAPINEGSSGGPLVSMKGEVIGLNAAIYAPGGDFAGAGFAIPSNRIADFLTRNLPGYAGARADFAPVPTGGG